MWTPLKRERYYLQHGNTHEVQHREKRVRERPQSEYDRFSSVSGEVWLGSGWVFSSPRQISFEANCRSVVVVYRASAGMRKGADGGHTD